MTKYLKHINAAISTYASGRSDSPTLSAAPGFVIKYDDVVVEDNTSVDYNAHIWNNYIVNNYWTVIEIPSGPPVWNDFVTSYAPVLSPGHQTWVASWPIVINDPVTSFSFAAGPEVSNSYGTPGNDLITVTDAALASNRSSIFITLTTLYLTGVWSTYNCEAIINGVTYSAVLTAEYSPLGS